MVKFLKVRQRLPGGMATGCSPTERAGVIMIQQSWASAASCCLFRKV